MSTWNKLATQKLSRKELADQLRIVVMGVGYEFGGDDAAGAAVAASLLEMAVRVNNPDLLVINAGVAPENFTGAIRRFQPEVVVLVDAAQMDEAPGTIAWLDWHETTGMTTATHGLPLHIIAQYLTNEIGCEVYLIGIQPSANRFDSQMSEIVAQAVREVSHTLAKLVIIPVNDTDSPDKPLAI